MNYCRSSSQNQDKALNNKLKAPDHVALYILRVTFYIYSLNLGY
jgi:hypothetical protein